MTLFQDMSPQAFGMPWPEGNAFGMPGWADPSGMPPRAATWPHPGQEIGYPQDPQAWSMTQMPGQISAKVPPGIEPDDHNYCHMKGMEAYTEMYKRTMEQRLETKKQMKKKEEKEKQKKADAAAKAGSGMPEKAATWAPPGQTMQEPMYVPQAGSGMPDRAATWAHPGQTMQAKQPAPPANAPTSLPSKEPTSLPDPPKHDAEGLRFGAPPGLAEPSPPPGLSGMPERASTWAHPGQTMQTEARKSSTAITGPAMQTLKKSSDGTIPFQWNVDSRKLNTTDKVCVSPSFQWPADNDCGASAKFKMMIQPKAVNEKKGGASFKKAKGKVVLEVKCEANPPQKEVKMRISVTDRLNPKQLTDASAPVSHNFSEANICTMKSRELDGEWELPVDGGQATFIVKLEIYDDDDDSEPDC